MPFLMPIDKLYVFSDFTIYYNIIEEKMIKFAIEITALHTSHG